MIWGMGQYLSLVPVVLMTTGAAIVSVLVAFETAKVGAWWLPAVGLALLALAVEIAKPFAVAARMWGVVLVCITISGLAELQMVSRGRAVYADTASKVEQRDERLSRRRDELARELAAVGPARSEAEMRPLVEAAQAVAGDCPGRMGSAQRDACRRLPALQSEAARAGERARLLAEIEKIDDRQELQQRGKTAEGDALAMVLGWLGARIDPAHVDQTLALLLVVLFQLAHVGSARIATSFAHGARPPSQEAKNAEISTGSPEPDGGANDDDLRHLIAPPDEHELLVTFLRGKGGAYAGSRRQLAELLGWSRRTLDRRLNQMIGAGSVVVTERGLELAQLEDGR